MKMLVVLIMMVIFCCNSFAGTTVATNAAIIGAAVAVATGAARTATINSEQSSSSSYGEIKAVCPCVETTFGCSQFCGFKICLDKTFHQVAVECSGRVDAKVIGINTYQNEIYVTWKD